MTTFSKFVCWKPASLGLIAAEAVDTSVPMFLATHQPVRCWGSFYGKPRTKKLVDERDVLEHLEERRTENLIIPIIGGTGTGKSHLVRWLRYHVTRVDDRQIIYVPRDKTSLADVIELVLDSVPDDLGDDLTTRIEDFRQDLRRASGVVSDDELRRRVLHNVVLAIRRLNPAASPYADPKDQDYWRFLVGALPRMLGDPIIEDGFVADDTVVSRIAARISRGRSGDESGHEPLFTPSDLHPAVRDLGRAGQDAKHLHDRFQRGAEPRLSEVASELLNGVVEGAVSSLMGLDDELGRPRLMSIMVELRRALHESGHELVLLVEDLAVLHGIQQQLLEALIQPIHSDEGDLCRIRAAIAVTSGVWATLERTVDTLASRIENWNCRIYDLDVEIDDAEAGISHEHTRAFVAGYLNAVRLGGARLDKEYDRHREGDGPFAAPSACIECKHREDCHEAFGASGDRGLYPLNAVAADRLVEVEASGADGRFEPRKIVNSLRRVLALAEDDIPASRFPSEALRDHFAHGGNAMSAALAHAIRQRDTKDAERRRTLLELWGPKPYGLRDLEIGVHTAFALPPLGIEGVEAPEPAIDPISVDPERTERTEREIQFTRFLEQIEAWGRGERRLEQRQAGQLRQLVFDAILARVDWESFSLGRSDELLREIGFPSPAACIAIDEAWASDTRAPANALVVSIPQDEASARLLSGLAQFRALGHWRFSLGGDALVLVANAVEPWARELEGRLAANGDEWAIDRSFSVQLLAMTARILSSAPHDADAETTLDSALTAYATPETDGRSREWQKLVESAVGRPTKSSAPTSRDELLESLLRRAGRSQGGGAAVAIDCADLLEAVTSFARGPNLPSDKVTLPAETRSWFGDIETQLLTAPKKEAERLREWQSLVGEQIPSTTTLESLADEIESVLDAVAKAGRGLGSDAGLRVAVAHLRSVDESAFRQLLLGAESTEKASTSDLLAIVSPDHSPVVDPTREVVLLTDAYFDSVERDLGKDGRASGGSDGVGTLATTALAAIDDELQRLLDVLDTER